MRTDILATGVAAIIAGAFVVAGASGVYAQAKKTVPLELTGDAAARPWKRYPGWPVADYSKYNTLGQLASAPAPKEPRKIVGPVTGDAAQVATCAVTLTNSAGSSKTQRTSF